MPRRRKEEFLPTWKVLVYRPHESGIGSRLVREVLVTEKPSFETGFYIDVTNRCWAMDEPQWQKWVARTRWEPGGATGRKKDGYSDYWRKQRAARRRR